MRNRLILILGIITLLFFIIAVGSCSSSRRQRILKEKEIATRLDLEAKLANFNREKANLEAKLKETQGALQEKTAALESAKTALSQQQLINTSLREELDKVTKLKESLEEELNEFRPGRTSK